MQVLAIINNIGVKIIVDLKAKNWYRQRCDKRFIWNPNICEYECDKLCEIGQCLDIKNFRCRKELISMLVKECRENVHENQMVYNATINDPRELWNYNIHIIISHIFHNKDTH